MNPSTADEVKTAQQCDRLIAFGILAFLPIAVVLIPWDFGPSEDQYRQLMAGHSLSTIVIELLIFITLFKNENLVSDFLKRCSRMDRIVGMIFLLTISYSFLFVSASKILFILGFLALFIHLLFSVSLFKNMRGVDQQTQQLFWLVLGMSVIGYTGLWAADFLQFRPSERDWIDRVPGVTNIRWAGFFWLSIFAAGFASINVSGLKYFLRAGFFGAFGLTMTLWTGTRGSLLAIAFGTFCAIILSPVYRKRIVKYSLMSLAWAILINTILPVPHQQYGMDRIFSKSRIDQAANRVGSGRTELWTNTLEIVKNHPFVGHGVDQYQKMGPKETLGFKGPHSLLLQILFSVGLIGALTFIYCTWRFLRIFRLDIKFPHQLAALVFFTGGCLYSVYDNFAYYPYSIAISTIAIFMLFKPRESGDMRENRIFAVVDGAAA